MNIKESRTWSFIIVAIIYILAFFVGWATYKLLAPTGWHYLWKLFIADAVATIFVWVFGLIFKNVSVYDPYWSVVPPIVLTLWACASGPWSSATGLLLIAVWYWGIRLTGNWAYTFKGLNHEDWRYTKYRTEQKPFVFHLINFFGLNMMPTIIVFLVMIPGFFVIDAAEPANILTVFGFLLCIVAATLQLVSDTQRHRFAKAHKGQVCNVGLWKHARHPNYFGEILMWWGVWTMYLSTSQGGHSILDLCVIGAVLNTCLFRFISVPLMENRQLKNKPEYEEYRRNTRMFF
jgi:steroid 5-alpha reductase family enzyme